MSIKVENRPFNASESLAARFPPGSKGTTAGATFGAVLNTAQTQQSEASQELEKYLKMTPEERMASAMRKQLGITDDQYNAMSPEQKKAVDEKIAQMIKQKMQEEMAAKQHDGTGYLQSGISL
ncbi:hypothetical protein [Duganella callida]|uniref:Uncharacterized protein n=1 Tax=Duganella callida TaxID=2561932 RepID=A0A4Y9SZH0_9BURK|nr:hypothetical protein [Duganella callida]TFW30634.1 hypothetical protein E4L98_01745 [Duganella callida]